MAVISKLPISASLLMFVMQASALAWGPGHTDINRIVAEVLPEEIKTFLGKDGGKRIVDGAGIPDGSMPWGSELLKPVVFSPEDLAILKTNRLTSTFQLHGHTGQAFAFSFLARAFASGNTNQAIFWIASLSHSMADEPACNHDPLIEIITYAYADYPMQMGRGVGLDFADVAQDKETQALIARRMAELKPAPFSADPREALMRVTLSGLYANAYMTRRGTCIAATMAPNASPHVMEQGRVALVELGLYGVKEVADTVVTAWLLARAGRMPEWNANMKEEYQRRKAAFIRTRPIEDDSLFTELMKNSATNRPAVGVLIEPSISMNEAKFSFGAKLLLAGLMRTLGKEGIAYRHVDVRDLEDKGLPSVAEMPVLAICAGGFGVSREGCNHLDAYRQSGGRLLWIGGEPYGLPKEFRDALQKPDEKLLPVTRDYGKKNPVLPKMTVLFRNELRTALGETPYRFVHDPNTHAGWQQPFCFYGIKPGAPNVRILADLCVDQTIVPIAGAALGTDRQPALVFLPEYMVTPYLLSPDTTVEDPSRPELDGVGRRVVLGVLRLLVPDLAAKS